MYYRVLEELTQNRHGPQVPAWEEVLTKVERKCLEEGFTPKRPGEKEEFCTINARVVRESKRVAQLEQDGGRNLRVGFIIN